MFDIEGPYRASRIKNWMNSVDDGLKIVAAIGALLSAIGALFSFFS
ncbi:hypothetical protein [Glaciimonas soli]|nr:hypothetical protein [Glaciimonas soli]